MLVDVSETTLEGTIDAHANAYCKKRKEKLMFKEISAYSSAQDAGAPHLSQLPSGGVQSVVGSELELEAIVKMSATVRLGPLRCKKLLSC